MNAQTIITAQSHDGRGIANINGKVTFIAGALPDEKVSFSYTKKHNKFDEGKIIQVLKPSPHREIPVCPHYAICGGCSLQHLKHTAQLTFKLKVLQEQLYHFGNLEPQTILPPITGPIWGYRGRARLSVKYVPKKQKVLIGFHEKNSNFVADVSCCKILHPLIGENLLTLAELISKLSIYQDIPQVEVAVGSHAIALIFRHLKPLLESDINLLQQFGKDYNFQIHLQPQGNESVHCIFAPKSNGCANLSYKLQNQNLELIFQPYDFTQINQAVNQQMVDRAIELLEPKSDDKILDLFCGLGNFTLALAKKCKKIVGIEGGAAMVKRAIENALHNNINNAEFYAADLTKDLLLNSPSNEILNSTYDKILLDPPRTGASEICHKITKFHAKTIIYVSCNPATLARDAKELMAQGYFLEAIGIIDMFPHTSHIETIARFEAS